MQKLVKPIAYAMLPLSIYIVIKQMEIISFDLPIDAVFISCVLMISFQIINTALLQIHNKHLTIIQILTAIIFVAPALLYLYSFISVSGYEEYIVIILGVMMFFEGLYSLH